MQTQGRSESRLGEVNYQQVRSLTLAENDERIQRLHQYQWINTLDLSSFRSFEMEFLLQEQILRLPRLEALKIFFQPSYFRKSEVNDPKILLSNYFTEAIFGEVPGEDAYELLDNTRESSELLPLADMPIDRTTDVPVDADDARLRDFFQRSRFNNLYINTPEKYFGWSWVAAQHLANEIFKVRHLNIFINNLLYLYNPKYALFLEQFSAPGWFTLTHPFPMAVFGSAADASHSTSTSFGKSSPPVNPVALSKSRDPAIDLNPPPKPPSALVNSFLRVETVRPALPSESAASASAALTVRRLPQLYYTADIAARRVRAIDVVAAKLTLGERFDLFAETFDFRSLINLQILDLTDEEEESEKISAYAWEKLSTLPKLHTLVINFGSLVDVEQAGTEIVRDPNNESAWHVELRPDPKVTHLARILKKLSYLQIRIHHADRHRRKQSRVPGVIRVKDVLRILKRSFPRVKIQAYWDG